jgi:hypothetical protein
MGVGVLVVEVEGDSVIKGSGVGEGRDTGKTVHNGWWRKGLEDIGR